jgi:hypothetical protein
VRGPADRVLALALINHLAIANNVPFAPVLRQFARLGRSVILEFVPKTDPEVQLLMRNREDVFVDYDVEHVEAEAKAFFGIEHREPVADSGRTLFLLEPR